MVFALPAQVSGSSQRMLDGVAVRVWAISELGESNMPRITTKVVQDRPQSRAGTLLSAETAPLLRGDGDISHVCGNCDTVLIEDVAEGDIISFYVLCPKCGETSLIENPGNKLL
jgi:hypothetical protein